MDHLKIGRAHLVGHSTGGAIAQVVAAGHPARIASLVLSGTWARPDARFRRLFEFRARVLRYHGVLYQMGNSEYHRFLYEKLRIHPGVVTKFRGALRPGSGMIRVHRKV